MKIRGKDFCGTWLWRRLMVNLPFDYLDTPAPGKKESPASMSMRGLEGVFLDCIHRTILHYFIKSWKYGSD